MGARVGARIRGFPNRTNVSFVRVVDEHTIDVRFFERGAGETMSSGTGSTGAAAAAVARGLVEQPGARADAGRSAGFAVGKRRYLSGRTRRNRRRRRVLSGRGNQTQVTIISKICGRRSSRNTARVGVVGLGYVGLPLAVEFAAGRIRRHRNRRRAKPKSTRINRGESYIQDIPTAVLAPLVKAGKLRATTDFSAGRSDSTPSTSACPRRCARPKIRT